MASVIDIRYMYLQSVNIHMMTSEMHIRYVQSIIILTQICDDEQNVCTAAVAVGHLAICQRSNDDHPSKVTIWILGFHLLLLSAILLRTRDYPVFKWWRKLL